MAYELLTLEIDARHVATVTLDRPEVHNALDDRLMAELTRAFAELEKDESVRIAVLAGNGKSFCAGGDLNWMRSTKGYSREENIADSNKLSMLYATLRNFSRPLIGIVHGAALGGGSGLAAVCDFVVAADDTKFGFPETRIGILPAVISPYAIEKIGFSAARAYFISGMPFSAATAKEIGLVHRVVPREKLDAAREEIVGEFLKAAPWASRKAKTLISNVVGYDATAFAKITVEAIADARVGEEGQEGTDAVLSRRKPKWAP
ncbi:MAG: enoyl-CoA hydratase-related protein [Alphaproteobacteria bacterium]